MFYELARAFLQLIFPPYCCHCQKIGSLLCQSCYEALVFLPKLDLGRGKLPYLDEVIGVLEFSEVTKSLIYSLKYAGVKDVAINLANLIFHCSVIKPVDFITFVPMHPEKINLRGFNQAELIAKQLSALCEIPLIDCLQKRKFTNSQASIKHKKLRELNSKYLFKIKYEFKEKINEKSFLIIDDVFTTGNTLNDCARALKMIGAKEVNGLVVTHEGS